jgi:pilus assembly protein CpaB
MSSITERKAGRNEVRPRAATGLASVAGMIAAIPIPAGEQITFNMLVAPQSAGGQAATLAASTPIGKRAITVQVDNISSLAGMIRPGDYVDVITILQVPMTGEDGKQTAQPALIPLFQNILVLAVGQQTGATPQASSRYKKEEPSKAEYSPLITLGLSPQEANLLAFVQEQGKIRLVLRSPADSRLENVQVVTSGNLITFLQSIFGGQGKEEEPVEPLEGQYLEVYRGLKKDKVLIGQ